MRSRRGRARISLEFSGRGVRGDNRFFQKGFLPGLCFFSCSPFHLFPHHTSAHAVAASGMALPVFAGEPSWKKDSPTPPPRTSVEMWSRRGRARISPEFSGRGVRGDNRFFQKGFLPGLCFIFFFLLLLFPYLDPLMQQRAGRRSTSCDCGGTFLKEGPPTPPPRTFVEMRSRRGRARISPEFSGRGVRGDNRFSKRGFSPASVLSSFFCFFSSPTLHPLMRRQRAGRRCRLLRGNLLERRIPPRPLQELLWRCVPGGAGPASPRSFPEEGCGEITAFPKRGFSPASVLSSFFCYFSFPHLDPLMRRQRAG